MLLNLKKLQGRPLAAVDGELGHVKDFYFDDKTWAVRYLVVDTGAWLTGRLVLISPHACGRFGAASEALPVDLTRRQVEHSPSIDTHRPVSRQYEENYYRYYGWPAYWEGGGLWGMTEFPAFVPAATPRDGLGVHEYPRWDDVHLRSSEAVRGYSIEATDGAIGSVSGFLLDDKTWTIRELVVETGHWYSGKEILISPAKVVRIGYADEKVFVNLTQADIRRTAENDVAIAGSASYPAA